MLMVNRCSSCVIALTVALAASAWPGAQGGPAEHARTDTPAQRAAERIRALQRESDALATQEKSLLVELRALEVDRQLKTEQLAAAERDVKETERRLNATLTRTAALRNAADTQRPGVEARMVHLYKMGRAGYWKLLLDV